MPVKLQFASLIFEKRFQDAISCCHMSCIASISCTMSNTAAKRQKKFNLKIEQTTTKTIVPYIIRVEKNKCVDNLCAYRTAILRFCFRIGKKAGFSNYASCMKLSQIYTVSSEIAKFKCNVSIAVMAY